MSELIENTVLSFTLTDQNLNNPPPRNEPLKPVRTFSVISAECTSILSAAPAKSGPLDFPSEKSFLLFFAHEKGLGHMFQK